MFHVFVARVVANATSPVFRDLVIDSLRYFYAFYNDAVGTVGTVASGAYQRAVHAHRAGVELTCSACPGFVEFVERGQTEGDEITVLAERLLAPLREAQVDTLLLGCTHYPFIKPMLQTLVADSVSLIDTGAAVARQLQRLLDERALLAPGPARPGSLGDGYCLNQAEAAVLGPMPSGSSSRSSAGVRP